MKYVNTDEEVLKKLNLSGSNVAESLKDGQVLFEEYCFEQMVAEKPLKTELTQTSVTASMSALETRSDRTMKTVPEKILEKKIMEIVLGRGKLKLNGDRELDTTAINQVFTMDEGRLDVLVFDRLGRLMRGNINRTGLHI